jgi:hypothetical protein
MHFINEFCSVTIVNYFNRKNEKLIVQQKNIFMVSF